METDAEPDLVRAVRIRTYLGRVRDVKRAALAVMPNAGGWHLVVLSVERTSEAERVAPVLDRLARQWNDGL